MGQGDNAAGNVVVPGLGQDDTYRVCVCNRAAGCKHWHARVVDALGNRSNLVGSLAFPKNHFREATTQGSVIIDPGETHVTGVEAP